MALIHGRSHLAIGGLLTFNARRRPLGVFATLTWVALLTAACGDDTTDSVADAGAIGTVDLDDAQDPLDAGTDYTATDDSDYTGTSNTLPIADAGVTDTPTLDGGIDGDAATPPNRDASTPELDAGVTAPGDAAAALDAGVDFDAAALPDGAVVSPDTNIFRPEELPPTTELIEQLSLPEGFTIDTFAMGLGKARMLATWGDNVYVTRPEEGDVLRFAAPSSNGMAEEQFTVASGLPLAHGIAFYEENVYLATATEVLVAAVNEDGSFGPLTTIIDDLPDGGQHPYRTLGIGPDAALYISVGSSCDACAESNPEHATLLRSTLDGTARTVFARGLRNTIGFDWHPITGELWGMDHGSDNRGDDIPPEELNLLSEGSDYGWPYCYGDRLSDPIIDDPSNTTKEAYCALTTGPVLQTEAHNAPIGFTFYRGSAFPSEYRSSAFVALRGSWNRLPPGGYKIARVEFDEAGDPTRITDFVSGFLSDDGATTFARPAGIAVTTDGVLLFTDDSNGVIYRVSYVADDAGAGDAGN